MAHIQISQDATLFWQRFVRSEQQLYAMLLAGQGVDDYLKSMMDPKYHNAISILVADTPGMLYNKLRNSNQYNLVLSTGNRVECIPFVEQFYNAYRGTILQHFFVTKYINSSMLAIDEKTNFNGVLVSGLRFNISKVGDRYDMMVFVDDVNLSFTEENKNYAYVEPNDDLMVATYMLLGEYNLLMRINKMQFYPSILYPDIIRKTIQEVREQMDSCLHCSYCGCPSYCVNFISREYCSTACRQTATSPTAQTPKAKKTPGQIAVQMLR